MEQSVIEEKLRTLLSAEIREESQVVYLLIEIRKYMDITKTAAKYAVLRMFCNWVAHTNLDTLGSDNVLQRIDEAVDKAQWFSGPTPESVRNVLSEISSMEVFESELTRFLQNCSLPTEITGSPAQWARFLHLYVRIISECPLQHASKQPLKHVKDAILSVKEISNEKTSDREFGYASWRWHINFKDGTNMGVDSGLAYGKA